MVCGRWPIASASVSGEYCDQGLVEPQLAPRHRPGADQGSHERRFSAAARADDPERIARLQFERHSEHGGPRPRRRHDREVPNGYAWTRPRHAVLLLRHLGELGHEEPQRRSACPADVLRQCPMTWSIGEGPARASPSSRSWRPATSALRSPDRRRPPGWPTAGPGGPSWTRHRRRWHGRRARAYARSY